jgi:hypothetical protein
MVGTSPRLAVTAAAAAGVDAGTQRGRYAGIQAAGEQRLHVVGRVRLGLDVCYRADSPPVGAKP